MEEVITCRTTRATPSHPKLWGGGRVQTSTSLSKNITLPEPRNEQFIFYSTLGRRICLSLSFNATVVTYALTHQYSHPIATFVTHALAVSPIGSHLIPLKCPTASYPPILNTHIHVSGLIWGFQAEQIRQQTSS